MLTKKIVEIAVSESCWDLGNQTLYDLCKHHPLHEKHSEIIAKVWIIGRSYAAAIERRKPQNVVLDENFYIDKVAPKIRRSGIDSWFDELRKYREINENSLPILLSTHLELTNLFNDISGLDKRSLASKYLHFHFPHLFYIYDSRALIGLSTLKKYTGRVGRSKFISDNDYRKLFEKCIALRICIERKYEKKFSPRQIDNLLLYYAENA